jgi:hypothetical protein
VLDFSESKCEQKTRKEKKDPRKERKMRREQKSIGTAKKEFRLGKTAECHFKLNPRKTNSDIIANENMTWNQINHLDDRINVFTTAILNQEIMKLPIETES